MFITATALVSLVLDSSYCRSNSFRPVVIFFRMAGVGHSVALDHCRNHYFRCGCRVQSQSYFASFTTLLKQITAEIIYCVLDNNDMHCIDTLGPGRLLLPWTTAETKCSRVRQMQRHSNHGFRNGKPSQSRVESKRNRTGWTRPQRHSKLVPQSSLSPRKFLD